MLWGSGHRNGFSSWLAHAKLRAAACLAEPSTKVEQGYKV